MKKPMIMIEGFAGMRESEPFITAAQNKKNESLNLKIDCDMVLPQSF